MPKLVFCSLFYATSVKNNCAQIVKSFT